MTIKKIHDDLVNHANNKMFVNMTLGSISLELFPSLLGAFCSLKTIETYDFSALLDRFKNLVDSVDPRNNMQFENAVEVSHSIKDLFRAFPQYQEQLKPFGTYISSTLVLR